MTGSRKLKAIELADSSYFNIVRSAVECPSKEATGYLFGVLSPKHFIIHNAYPVITAERKNSEVSYGNESAIKRLHNLDRVIRESDSSAPYLVGGYHTHPAPDDGGLSELDDEFVKDEMSKLDMSKWIEILVLIGNKKFKNRREEGESLTSREGRLNVSIRDAPRHGYSMTLSAHLFDVEEGPFKSSSRIALIRTSGRNSK